MKNTDSKKKKSVWKELFPYILILGIVLVLRIFVFINAVIPSGSMESTIPVGARVMGLKCSYLIEEPQRGDIIVFDADRVDPGNLYIKRIIAIPGDTIEIKDGETILNGEILEEDYLKEREWDGENVPETTVPEDCYFVMGDNRNDSNDARFWGEENRWVTSDEIIGKAYFTYWPLSEIAWLD